LESKGEYLVTAKDKFSITLSKSVKWVVITKEYSAPVMYHSYHSTLVLSHYMCQCAVTMSWYLRLH